MFFKLFFSLRYRGRPTPAPVGGRQMQEKVEQPEAGGCTHASEEMVKKKKKKKIIVTHIQLNIGQWS